MKYQVQENCLTIFLPHELDHHNAEEIRRESDHLIIRNHIRYIIFDFAETDFMDSSGIGMIMGRYRQIYMLGGEICAAHANERVKKIFLTRSQTRPATLGSRLKRLRLAAAHSLCAVGAQLARVRAEMYFLRRTCRRRK